MKKSSFLNWNKYLRVACQETIGSPSQDARGEDHDIGVWPECHDHPGEDAGHSRGDQQLFGTKPLLEEPPSHSEYDGRDVLDYSNDSISQAVHLPMLVFHHVVVMFD